MVVVMPSDQWGAPGDTETGLLGADVAHGYLHGLPSECCRTTGISSVITTRSVCSPFGYHSTDHNAAANANATTVASSAAAANNPSHQVTGISPSPPLLFFLLLFLSDTHITPHVMILINVSLLTPPYHTHTYCTPNIHIQQPLDHGMAHPYTGNHPPTHPYSTESKQQPYPFPPPTAGGPANNNNKGAPPPPLPQHVLQQQQLRQQHQ